MVSDRIFPEIKTQTLFSWLTRACDCGDQLLLVKSDGHLALQNRRTSQMFMIGNKDLEFIKGNLKERIQEYNVN